MKYAMKLAAPLFLATLTTAQVAQAGSATGTMNVSGNVQGSCTVSAVALNFGAITPGSATDATSGYYTRRGPVPMRPIHHHQHCICFGHSGGVYQHCNRRHDQKSDPQAQRPKNVISGTKNTTQI